MTQPSVAVPLVTLVLGLSVWLYITRLRIGPMLSPISISLLVLVSIFGVRPLALIRYSNYEFYGYDIKLGFNYAAIAGLVGIILLVLGWTIADIAESRYRTRSHESPFIDAVDQAPPRMKPVAMVSLGWIALWLFSQVILGGGVDYFTTLFAGRSSANLQTQAGVPSALSLLPLVGAIAVSFVRIQLTQLSILQRSDRVWFWVVVALSIVPPTALGSRRFLIPTIVAALIALVSGNWDRVLRLRYIVFFFVAFVLLTAIPYIRSAGARTNSDSSFVGALIGYITSNGLEGVLSQYFVSYDTEMFDFVALFRLNILRGATYGFGRGTIVEYILNPLPASVSPTLWSDSILTTNFGGGCGNPYCPVLSIIGVAVSDAGLFGVAIVLPLFGFACRRMVSDISGDTFSLIKLTVWTFIPTFVRGNSPLILALATYTTILCILTFWLAKVRALDRTTSQLADYRPSTRISITRDSSQDKLISR